MLIKGSAIIVWDREDYAKETGNQFSDSNIYEEAANYAKLFMDIMLNPLKNIRKRKDLRTDTLNYVIIEGAMFARFYLLGKIHEKLYNARKVFLQFWILIYNQLPKIFKSYIKDITNFVKKVLLSQFHLKIFFMCDGCSWFVSKYYTWQGIVSSQKTTR